jgi:parvulin-like peptidyl-prolyl isomerase
MEYYLDILTLYLQGLEPTQVSILSESVLGTIVQNHLVIQRAPDLGIYVTDEEIIGRLEQPGLPDNKAYRDVLNAELLREKLFENYVDPKVPATVEQVKVQAMFLADANVAEEVRGKLENGGSFSSLAEEYSVDQAIKSQKGDLGWLPLGMLDKVFGDFSDSSLEDIAFGLEPGELSQPVYDATFKKLGGYWIIEVLENDGDTSSHVRGILLSTLEEANETKKRLESGEDFNDVVVDVSQHSQSWEYGGDLGWVQRGYGNEAIIEVAFELEPGKLSEPVFDDTAEVTGGYWLVKVLDKDDARKLDDEIIDQLKDEIYSQWIEEQRDTSVVELYITEEQRAWAVERYLSERGTQL